MFKKYSLNLLKYHRMRYICVIISTNIFLFIIWKNKQ